MHIYFIRGGKWKILLGFYHSCAHFSGIANQSKVLNSLLVSPTSFGVSSRESFNIITRLISVHSVTLNTISIMTLKNSSITLIKLNFVDYFHFFHVLDVSVCEAFCLKGFHPDLLFNYSAPKSIFLTMNIHSRALSSLELFAFA